MKVYNVLTIFPSMFESPFEKGVMSKAIESGLIKINSVNIRDFTTDKHKTTDDYQYGGGVGLVMKPEPIIRAVEDIKSKTSTHVVILDPRGKKFDQNVAKRLANHDNITFICGRYEGIDERVRQLCADELISLGDFIISGGELAAMTIIDAVSRLVPGVLGDSESLYEESFNNDLLEYPHYTRPPEFQGLSVPEVLLSGHHKLIEQWRKEKAIEETTRSRPELMQESTVPKDVKEDMYSLTSQKKGKKLKIALALLHYPMKDKKGNVVTASITNMDLHDISRSATTYGVDKYFVVTPLLAQQEIAKKVIKHWTHGYGSTYNENRKDAFTNTHIVDSLIKAIYECEQYWGVTPLIVATTARPDRANISTKTLGKIAEDRPILILFGTGWGFTQEIFELSDYILEPILGATEFNHLSVRSAVAILLDRITKL